MKLKNKIILILLTILIFLLSFNFNNVKAFTGIDVSGNTFNCPDIPNDIDYSNGYIFKLNPSSSAYKSYLFIYKSADTYVYYNSNNKHVYFYGSISIYRLEGNNYIFETTKTTTSLTPVEYSKLGLLSEFTLFSQGLYNSSDKSLGFFIQPPLVVTQVEELPKAITTTLKILIPVGLVVLGIGLIIYLIKRVIYSVR